LGSDLFLQHRNGFVLFLHQHTILSPYS
jgi:hypothetical protein